MIIEIRRANTQWTLNGIHGVQRPLVIATWLVKIIAFNSGSGRLGACPGYCGRRLRRGHRAAGLDHDNVDRTAGLDNDWVLHKQHNWTAMRTGRSVTHYISSYILLDNPG
jgi:hypothetical protein